MGEFGIGQPVRRKEDVRLLTGGGEYTDDIAVEGELLHAAFVRSPHANAKILSIDTSDAMAIPGVVAVLTGKDVQEAGLGMVVTDATYTDRSGKAMNKPGRSVMPADQTRFVGEVLAMVVADNRNTARDAAEAVLIDFEPLPAAVGTAKALDPATPKVWPEFDSNLVVHWEYGERDKIEQKLASAAKRVSVDLINNRLAVVPMEPRVVTVAYDKSNDGLTIYSPTQGASRIQGTISQTVLNIPQDKVRVVSKDTGGGFGIRSKTYPETAMAAFAAHRLKKSVKWQGDRSETFMSDYQGRDQLNHAEMGLDQNGKIVALKVETIVNVGAYLSENGVRLPMEGGGRILPCMYHVDDFYFSVKPVFTNQICTDTYRGAGRPEANYIMERLMDLAAEACNLPRDEVRRRNFIQPEQMPYKTHLGFVIDTGEFDATMQMALDAGDWNGFEARRKEALARGKYRGIGLAAFVEGAGSRPMEGMRAKVDKDGGVTLYAGTYSHGQGHDTVYAQLVNEFLGVDFDKVTLVDGDTQTNPAVSVGTFGSRSSMVGGMSIRMSCDSIIVKGTKIAAHLLQSSEDQVSFSVSEALFKTQTASISFDEVAAAAHDPARLPDGMDPGLDEEVTYKGDTENFPNGAHVVEVEVDADTGIVEIVSYVAVDDCGVVLNPFIVHGQAQGGIAQGVGQALTEDIVYDEDGQLVTASFMDYAMPRAHHLSHIDGHFNIVPSKTNPLGVKGAGEAGATGAPPAIVGAVVDALKDFGIKHIDMPLTPERVWRAIEAAKKGKAA